MDVLITGGAGFIGGHLAERLVRDGHNIVVFDSFAPFYSTEIKEQNVEIGRAAASGNDGSYRLVEGDVRDADLVEDLVAGADVVYHQAGLAGVRPSVERPRTYHEVNVGGTLNVLDAARETDIERVVVASSSSVYGTPDYLPYDEDHPTRPVSPYGTSKLAAERYAGSYSVVYDLPTVALRYFTVYGPRMRPNMAISNFVSRCMNGKPPVIFGDGTQTRDFTFVEDVVEANVSLLDTSGADGEALNIGSTDNIEIGTLAIEVRDQLAPELDLEYGEKHEADTQHTHSDTGKARRLIGYEPTTTIREGVQQYIDWYGENRDWYEPLLLDS